MFQQEGGKRMRTPITKPSYSITCESHENAAGNKEQVAP